MTTAVTPDLRIQADRLASRIHADAREWTARATAAPSERAATVLRGYADRSYRIHLRAILRAARRSAAAGFPYAPEFLAGVRRQLAHYAAREKEQGR